MPIGPRRGWFPSEHCRSRARPRSSTGSIAGPGTGACNDLPGKIANGTNSGFDNPQNVTVSPNGANVYVGSGNDASVTRFSRTAGTGALSWQDCISRETGDATCTVLPGDQANGFDTGFDNLRAIAVSPDSASLYVTSGGDAAIDRFSRDPGSGALTFQDCISGDTQTGPTGTNDCMLIPSATPQGDQSGWAVAGNAPALAIRPDGSQVLFGTGGDDSVVQLERNAATGALTFRRCLTGEIESASVCISIAPSAIAGTNTGLNGVNSLGLSPDGNSLYATAVNSDAVARLAIEPIEPAPVVSPPVVSTPPNPPVITKKKCKKHKKRAAAAKKKCKKKRQ